MSSIPGVKDEVLVEGFRFQKYLKEKLIHIHNPEDEKIEVPLKSFQKELKKLIPKLEDRDVLEYKLSTLSIERVSKGDENLRLILKSCKTTVCDTLFKSKMEEFLRILEEK